MALTDHSVPKSKIERKPPKFFLDLCKQKSLRSLGQVSNLNYKNTEPWPLKPQPDLSQFMDPEPLE